MNGRGCRSRVHDCRVAHLGSISSLLCGLLRWRLLGGPRRLLRGRCFRRLGSRMAGRSRYPPILYLRRLLLLLLLLRGRWVLLRGARGIRGMALVRRVVPVEIPIRQPSGRRFRCAWCRHVLELRRVGVCRLECRHGGWGWVASVVALRLWLAPHLHGCGSLVGLLTRLQCVWRRCRGNRSWCWRRFPLRRWTWLVVVENPEYVTLTAFRGRGSRRGGSGGGGRGHCGRC